MMTPAEYAARAVSINSVVQTPGGPMRLDDRLAKNITEEIRLAILDEREACASLATEFCVGVHDDNCPACDAAVAIRARP